MASTDRTAEEPSEALAGEVYPIGRHALDDPNLFDVKTEPYEPEENPLPKSDEGFSCDELSDITEEFDRVRSVGTSQLSGLWHSQLRPLFQHPHMKYVALANLILFLVVVFLLALMVALAIVAAVFHYEALVNNESEIPCVYEWMEWSQCSATCRTPDQPVPTKSRSVDPKSIIRARGRMYQTAPCPERVSQLTDSAPCNTHWCPIKLSTLKFLDCKYSVRHNRKIELRAIPMDDQLVMWGVRLGNQQTGPQFVQPLPGNVGEIEENTALHLECKVEPFHDDSLQIFWLHNGRPLNHGHRFRTFHDFGLVTLDILHVYAEDSGTFTCVAENSNGRAETSTDFYCHPKDSILDQTQLPTSVARIQELEAPKGPVQEEEPEIVYNPANFIKPLQGSIQANEGESVFLEAKAGPVEDNTLAHEWYFNNQLLMHANRFVTAQEFGVITMNILYLYPEDTGTYTLFIRNATGQAQSSVDIKVAGNGSMFINTFHPKSVNRINELEAPKPLPEEVPEAEKKQPVITKQLNSVPTCNEGDSAHFEAKYTPTDDNQVSVEWLFNGRPIKHSNRHRMINDFGNVSLDINYLFVEDSGEYTLIVKNRKGQAQTSTKLQVNGSERILDNTMHPKSLPRIQQLEMPPPLPEEKPEKPEEPPKFKRALQLVVSSQDGNPSSQAIQEGDDVKIDCTVSPITDNQLRVEWYFNGQPLLHSNRIRITNDLGYVALQFPHICARDSGNYTCRAISPCGSAEASISVDVKPAADMLLETQHEKSWKEIFEMENRTIERPETPEAKYEAPRFSQNLSNVDSAVEGDTIRLECRLKPVDDPSLRVFWTFNGNPLFEASRFRHHQSLDLVELEISKAVAEDSGKYECHARSANGQSSTGCEVKVKATESLLLNTQNERTWSKIQQLEITDELPEPPEKPFSAPKFSQNLESVKLKEGEAILLSTRISPDDDPNLTIVWLKDGQPVFSSNRVHQLFEFGLVALEIVHSIQNDAGNYTVVAKNAAGQAQLSAKVEVEGNESILAEVQHELSWRKIQELEAPKMALEEIPEKKHNPPQFWSQLQSIKDAVEGETVKLEAKVKPIDDPNLVITWYHNDQVLGASNRFVTRNEFGHISLEILYVMGQDAGTYRCVATNQQGQASSKAKVECKLNPAIWSQTQHEKALKKIQELEAPKPEKPEIAPVYLVAPKRMNCFMRKNY